ncbi:hypothetical protein EXU85_20510 [Spirosoma sp. KCTC 42546]|uniref:hypothetical protein n=1 Tax=Spirosoma sp. KCTC 42546 TaxID=2520506 RepID=UPI001157B277|nr:hypothetical protein [Spirosoma sp. KCTC 42546]QDK80863.1 hypothetical protein EXU85_20510 [Spirosoma sp. KCTC 42546]
MRKQKTVDVGKWYVTIIGIKPDAPSYVSDHFKCPVRAQVRNNVFNPPSPIICHPHEAHLWRADFFIFQKKTS